MSEPESPGPVTVTLRLPYLKHSDGGSADLVLEDVSVEALAAAGFVPQQQLTEAKAEVEAVRRALATETKVREMSWAHHDEHHERDNARWLKMCQALGKVVDGEPAIAWPAIFDMVAQLTAANALASELRERAEEAEANTDRSLAAAARRIGELEGAIADVADGLEQQGKRGLASQLRQFLPASQPPTTTSVALATPVERNTLRDQLATERAKREHLEAGAELLFWELTGRRLPADYQQRATVWWDAEVKRRDKAAAPAAPAPAIPTQCNSCGGSGRCGLGRCYSCDGTGEPAVVSMPAAPAPAEGGQENIAENPHGNDIYGDAWLLARGVVEHHDMKPSYQAQREAANRVLWGPGPSERRKAEGAKAAEGEEIKDTTEALRLSLATVESLKAERAALVESLEALVVGWRTSTVLGKEYGNLVARELNAALLRAQPSPTSEGKDSKAPRVPEKQAGDTRSRVPPSGGDSVDSPTDCPLCMPVSKHRSSCSDYTARLDGETGPKTSPRCGMLGCIGGAGHGGACPILPYCEPAPAAEVEQAAGEAKGFVHGQRVVVSKAANSRWAGCTGRVAQLHQLRVVVQLTDNIRDSFGYDELAAWVESSPPTPLPGGHGPTEARLAEAWRHLEYINESDDVKSLDPRMMREALNALVAAVAALTKWADELARGKS